MPAAQGQCQCETVRLYHLQGPCLAGYRHVRVVGDSAREQSDSESQTAAGIGASAYNKIFKTPRLASAVKSGELESGA